MNFFFTSKLGGLSLNFEDIKIFEKSNFWCKIVAQPTPFLGQIEPKYVQVGPILVQFGHVLNLHLLPIFVLLPGFQNASFLLRRNMPACKKSAPFGPV